MIKIRVYDSAMCCSSWVCGATVAPVLTEFAALLNAVDKSGGELIKDSQSGFFTQFSQINQAKTIEIMSAGITDN